MHPLLGYSVRPTSPFLVAFAITFMLFPQSFPSPRYRGFKPRDSWFGRLFFFIVLLILI